MQARKGRMQQCSYCPIGKHYCFQAGRLPAHIAAWHKDKTLIRAMPVFAAETTREKAAGELESDDIMRAREASLPACLFCFLFNPRSTRTVVCVYQRVDRLQALSSAEGPWKCTFCPTPMALPTAVALQTHMRVLHGDRAFFCDFCRFLSASAIDVAEHRREHDVTLTCPHCNLVFQGGTAFFAHASTHQEEQLKPGPKPRLALVCSSSYVVLAVHCVFVLLVQGQ